VSLWTPQRVLDAVVALEWFPDGAVEVRTDDYRLIRYPDWALDPTFPAAQVTRSRTGRTAAEIIDEAAARVRRWHLPGVAWWVSSATLPPDTEATLRARGGKRIDAVRILARELDRDPVDLAREFAEAVRDLEAWSSFRVLASVGGEPAAVGGCTLRAEVAHLWGAVALREYRRRGAYRAVLAERLRLARAHGATIALVKGRIETSGPILLRAGFAEYDEERCYWLPLSRGTRKERYSA